MEQGRLSMVSPSHKYFTIFYFPLGDTAWFPFLHIGTVVHIHCILRIIVLYCMVSYSQSDLHTYFPIFFNSLYVSVLHGSGGCVPRICLNSCDLARAESTERQALILGSPRFASKPREPHRSFVSAKLRRYAEPIQQVDRERIPGARRNTKWKS